MSEVYHIRHESNSPFPQGDSEHPSAPYPPPPPQVVPTLLGYPRPDLGGYQGYFHGAAAGYHHLPSAAPPPLRPYPHYHNNYGPSIACSSLLRGCLAALCCCCVLDEGCF